MTRGVRDNYKRLSFGSVLNFDLDSFQEKTTGNDKNPKSSDQNPTKSSAFVDQKPSSIKRDGNKNLQNERENNGLNKGLIVVLISLVAVFVLIFIFTSSKNREK